MNHIRPDLFLNLNLQLILWRLLPERNSPLRDRRRVSDLVLWRYNALHRN